MRSFKVFLLPTEPLKALTRDQSRTLRTWRNGRLVNRSEPLQQRVVLRAEIIQLLGPHRMDLGRGIRLELDAPLSGRVVLARSDSAHQVVDLGIECGVGGRELGDCRVESLDICIRTSALVLKS